MKIVAFDNQYAKDFAELNYAWLERFFWVEEHDREVLNNPNSYIIQNGGHIFFVIQNNQVIACAALMKEPHGWELSKMAVKEGLQGKGIGKELMNYLIDFAKAQGWKELMLYSNTRLAPAISLYKKMGFKKIPLEVDNPYERADIKMSKSL